jgi:hypothetical protein
VERRVPVFPFSREVGKLKQLQQGLALYRLAFGQPRQEDLLKFLVARDERAGQMGSALGAISLEPPEPAANDSAARALTENDRTPAPPE